MKHLTTCSILFLFSLNVCYAQGEPKFVYCQIVGYHGVMTSKVTVSIDFGQRMKFFADNRLKGDDGKAVVFNTMVDALNFMGSRGWEFVQAYSAVLNGNNQTTNFLMKKPYSDLDEESKKEFNKKE